MGKILSVIVPTYNMEKYLERCLSSLVVESEKMQKLEVLVINDGSKDRSSEIAHSYADKYPGTFVAIDKENGHYGSCINVGLKVSTGRYIKLLDSDDYYDTEAFSEFLDVLEDNDADMFITDERIVDENGKCTGYYDYHMAPNCIHGAVDLPVFIEDSIPHQSITWRTKIMKRIEYVQSEGIMYSDLEWVFRPLSEVRSFLYSPLPVYYYVRGREEQSVAPLVHGKNMWMENKVIFNNLKYFNEVEDNLAEENKQIMWFILRKNVERIYSHYLLNFHQTINIGDLKEYDVNLKIVSPKLYREVEEVTAKRKFMTFCFVQEWRKKKSRNTLPFIFFDTMNSLGYLVWRIKNR